MAVDPNISTVYIVNPTPDIYIKENGMRASHVMVTNSLVYTKRAETETIHVKKKAD